MVREVIAVGGPATDLEVEMGEVGTAPPAGLGVPLGGAEIERERQAPHLGADLPLRQAGVLLDELPEPLPVGRRGAVLGWAVGVREYSLAPSVSVELPAIEGGQRVCQAQALQPQLRARPESRA